MHILSRKLRGDVDISGSEDQFWKGRTYKIWRRGQKRCDVRGYNSRRGRRATVCFPEYLGSSNEHIAFEAAPIRGGKQMQGQYWSVGEGEYPIRVMRVVFGGLP